MKIAFLYVLNNCRRQLQYRVSFFGYLVLTSLVLSSQFLFFNRLLDLTSDLGGFGSSELYLMLYVSLSVLLCVEFIGASVNHYFDKVYHGGIEPYLTKPISPLLQVLLAWCSPLNLIILGLFNLFIVVAPISLKVDAVALNWIGFIVAVVCAVACNVGFLLLMNMATFFIQRKLPVEYVHSKVYELSIVPVDLMSPKFLRPALLFIPIAFSASVPVGVLVKGQFEYLALLVIATVVIVTLSVLGFQYTSRQFEGLGG